MNHSAATIHAWVAAGQLSKELTSPLILLHLQSFSGLGLCNFLHQTESQSPQKEMKFWKLLFHLQQ